MASARATAPAPATVPASQRWPDRDVPPSLLLVTGLLFAVGVLLLATGREEMSGAAIGGGVLLLSYLLVTGWTSPAAFLGFWAWLHVEDLIRTMTGSFLVFWVKDILLLALFIGYLRSGAYRRHGGNILGLPLIIYGAVVLAQIANPDISHPLIPLVGLHAKLLYIPLFFVAIAYFDSVVKVRSFLLFTTVALGVECGLALMQYFRDPQWWNSLMGINDQVEVVRLRSFEGGGLIRTASVFVPGRFQQFVGLAGVVLLGAQGLMASRTVSRYLWAVSILLIFAGGVAIQSSRTVFYLFCTAVFLIMLLRPSRRQLTVTAGLLVALVLVLTVWIPRLDSRINAYYFAPSSLSVRFDVYDGVGGRILRGLYQIEASVETAGLLGHGTGTSSQGLHHVTESLAMPKENGYAALVWELGFFGPVLWILLMGGVLRAVWRSYRDVRHTPYGQLAFAVSLSVAFAFVMQYVGLQYMENYLLTTHFWTFAGMAVALPRISLTTEMGSGRSAAAAP